MLIMSPSYFDLSFSLHNKKDNIIHLSQIMIALFKNKYYNCMQTVKPYHIILYTVIDRDLFANFLQQSELT